MAFNQGGKVKPWVLALVLVALLGGLGLLMSGAGKNAGNKGNTGPETNVPALQPGALNGLPTTNPANPAANPGNQPAAIAGPYPWPHQIELMLPHEGGKVLDDKATAEDFTFTLVANLYRDEPFKETGGATGLKDWPKPNHEIIGNVFGEAYDKTEAGKKLWLYGPIPQGGGAATGPPAVAFVNLLGVEILEVNTALQAYSNALLNAEGSEAAFDAAKEKPGPALDAVNALLESLKKPGADASFDSGKIQALTEVFNKDDEAMTAEAAAITETLSTHKPGEAIPYPAGGGAWTEATYFEKKMDEAKRLLTKLGADFDAAVAVLESAKQTAEQAAAAAATAPPAAPTAPTPAPAPAPTPAAVTLYQAKDGEATEEGDKTGIGTIEKLATSKEYTPREGDKFTYEYTFTTRGTGGVAHPAKKEGDKWQYYCNSCTGWFDLTELPAAPAPAPPAAPAPPPAATPPTTLVNRIFLNATTAKEYFDISIEDLEKDTAQPYQLVIRAKPEAFLKLLNEMPANSSKSLYVSLLLDYGATAGAAAKYEAGKIGIRVKVFKGQPKARDQMGYKADEVEFVAGSKVSRTVQLLGSHYPVPADPQSMLLASIEYKAPAGTASFPEEKTELEILEKGQPPEKAVKIAGTLVKVEGTDTHYFVFQLDPAYATGKKYGLKLLVNEKDVGLLFPEDEKEKTPVDWVEPLAYRVGYGTAEAAAVLLVGAMGPMGAHGVTGPAGVTGAAMPRYKATGGEAAKEGDGTGTIEGISGGFMFRTAVKTHPASQQTNGVWQYKCAGCGGKWFDLVPVQAAPTAPVGASPPVAGPKLVGAPGQCVVVIVKAGENCGNCKSLNIQLQTAYNRNAVLGPDDHPPEVVQLSVGGGRTVPLYYLPNNDDRLTTATQVDSSAGYADMAPITLVACGASDVTRVTGNFVDGKKNTVMRLLAQKMGSA